MDVKNTILELSPAAVAAASGFPYSTIYRWMQNDAIPGKGPSFEFRRQRLADAFRQLRARKKRDEKRAITRKAA